MPFPRETNSPKITTRIHKQAVVWQTGNNNLFMVIEIEESPILLGWLDWKWERKQRQIKSLTLCSNLANGLNDIQSIEGKCVCVCVSYFMQRECRWQRDVGTRTRQEGKARSRVWLVRSSDRDKSWRAWGESSPHLGGRKCEDRRQRVLSEQREVNVC